MRRNREGGSEWGMWAEKGVVQMFQSLLLKSLDPIKIWNLFPAVLQYGDVFQSSDFTLVEIKK